MSIMHEIGGHFACACSRAHGQRAHEPAPLRRDRTFHQPLPLQSSDATPFALGSGLSKSMTPSTACAHAAVEFCALQVVGRPYATFAYV